MTVAIRQNTPEWKALRRATIGSSDIPIIIGESTNKSAYTLAAEKLGLVSETVDPETQELFDIGHLMQPVLIELHARKTGLATKAEHGIRTSRALAWATASLDGTAPVRRVVEAKWTHAKKWRNGEGVPGDVQAQVQWQLFVVGWDVADVVVLDHQRARVETLERDDSFINDLIYFATEFHDRLERGELPPLDGSESTRQTLGARHPRDDGTWLPASPDLASLAGALAEARATKKAAEDTERTIGNALREIVGDASGIVDLVSLKKNRDSQRTNWPAVASAYREVITGLRYAWNERKEIELASLIDTDLDSLQSIHTDTVEGARVLRLLSKGSPE